MGLDMFAWSVAQEDVIDDFTIVKKDDSCPEIFYWRKHHALHKWMENLYRERGGTEEIFNCCVLRLYVEDLDNLGDVIGCDTDYDDLFSTHEQDIKFIEKARSVIADGRAVYYDSWW
jgi:hypothetical protein